MEIRPLTAEEQKYTYAQSMLYEYAEVRGSHKSLERYRYAKDAPEAHAIYRRYSDQIDDRYESMGEADKKSVWHKPTEKANRCL